MEPFRLVLVDDEKRILDGLRGSVPWGELGFEIAGAFQNGARALEYLREHPADALLTDIKMPMQDGLSLVESLRELGMDRLKVVFLSGYDDFQYAQSATRLGAVDYILKPSDPADIRRVFRKIRDQLDRERRSSYLMRESLPMLKIRVFDAVLNSAGDRRDAFLEEYLAEFGGAGETGFLTVCFTLPSIARMEAVEGDLEARLQAFREVCADYFRPLTASSGLLDKYVYYTDDLWTSTAVFSLAGESPAEAGVSRRMEELAAALRGTGGPGLAWAMGGVERDLRRAGRSRDGALIQLFGGTGWEDDALLRKIWGDAELFAAIRSREVEELESRLDSWLRQAGGDPVCWRAIAYHLYLAFLSAGEPGEPAEKLRAHLRAGAEAMDREGLRKTAVGFLQAESARPELSSGKNLKRSLEIARYIGEHFDQDISLASLSRQFFMSPNYISRLFKENMGVGVKEYLTRVRLDHADYLIQEGSLKLYQIAEQVGYPNYEYFRKTYHRYRGRNPSGG